MKGAPNETQRVVLGDSLKAALEEKILFFLFAENMLTVPF